MAKAIYEGFRIIFFTLLIAGNITGAIINFMAARYILFGLCCAFALYFATNLVCITVAYTLSK